MAYVTVATCALNQFAMDFNANLRNIIESIRIAKAKSARIRIGPELEVCGYGCEDHFLEEDTVQHCWESICDILKDPDLTLGILCDIGMPVLHQGVRYNCRVLILNQRIILIRPKMWLAEDGNYREGRWFAPWSKGFHTEEFSLPRKVRQATGGNQTMCPFGVGIIRLGDTMYAIETCEELFTANNPGISLGLAGVEIIGNGSGSHHSMQKRRRRFELIEETTKKNGGIYLYANQIGCDGARLFFDGCAMVACNGSVINFGSQFAIREVEVITVTVDLRDVRSFRAAVPSRGRQAAIVNSIPMVDVDFFVTTDNDAASLHRMGGVTTDHPRPIQHHDVEEELCLGPACWLWDYLRRSGLNGFFLPLSGGSDSAATAALVGVMCQEVFDEITYDRPCRALADLRRIVKDEHFHPQTWREICSRLFYCCYMGTQFSSESTFNRAKDLAADLGANFDHMVIDDVCKAFEACWSQVSHGREPSIRATLEPVPPVVPPPPPPPPPPTAVENSPRSGMTTPRSGAVPMFLSRSFVAHPPVPTPPSGRAVTENLALQNIQARSRMVMSYLMAQLCLWRDHPQRAWPGSLLVLGSANLDESLRGYFTKYDCSSADINPIGSWNKMTVKLFLRYAAKHREMPSLKAIVESHSSAELQPTNEEGQQTQNSEDEMGMSFEELELFGKLRQELRCGPVSMYHKLRGIAPFSSVTPTEIGQKVKRFFKFYSQNRHKTTILPPAYHMSPSSNDDNRFDLRQIVYNTDWPRQFAVLDDYVQRDERAVVAPSTPTSASAPGGSSMHLTGATDTSSWRKRGRQDDHHGNAPSSSSAHRPFQ